MAVRKVQTVSSTGSSDSYRVRVNLTIRVTKVSQVLKVSACIGCLPNGPSNSTALSLPSFVL